MPQPFRGNPAPLLTIVLLLGLAWLIPQGAQATTCANATVINPASLPISNQAVVCGSSNDLSSSNVTACGSAGTNYMGGFEALYTFTPANTGPYQIAYAGQSWVSVQVFAGCPNGGGSCVNGASTSGSAIGITVTLNAGVQYYIMFDTWPSPNSPCPGTFSLGPPPPPPANDNPCNAIALTVNPTPACTNQTAGSLVNATPTTGVPTSPCYGTPDNDIWYSFVATNSTHYISLNNVTGNVTDMYHAVYSGNCNSLTNISCSDPNSSTVTGLTVGQTYWIRVYTYFSSSSGDITNFNICVGSPGPPPANDNPCNAQVVTPNPNLTCTNQVAGTTGGATPSGLPTSPCYGTPDNDVWYRFVATSTTHYISLNNINGSSTDMYIAVYTGTCGNLTNIACSDPESMTLNGLTVGQTYWIRIYTYFSSGANDVTNFDLCITTQAPMPVLHCGDNFYDPGGPSGNYPNGTNFTQTICPTNPGDAVTLTFTMFNTESYYDVMTIYDGPNTSSPAIGSYSGSTIPGPFTASDPSGCLTVVFTSDGSVNYAGWAANITCTPWTPPPPSCGTVVYDEGGPTGNYPANSNYTKTYCPDNPGDVVTLIFTSFQTENNWDYLYIYDGPNTAAPLLGTFTGNNLPPVFTSSHSSGCITIRFTSDGSVNYAGWSALVLCQPMPTGGDCVYALILEDSGNNGWGSSQVGVRINGGPWTYYTVTASMNVVLLGVSLGDLIEIIYDNSGPNQNQNRYSIGKLGQAPYWTSNQPPEPGITFSQIVHCGPPPSPPQDCAGGITVCSALAINNNATDWGETQDLNSTNQGCLSTEHMGTWYFFSPQTSGTIGFSITPSNAYDDYDFAVWGPYTEARCPTEPPLRCSWNAPPSYITGLGNGATDTSEGASGDGWVKTIDVLPDQVYVLYIDNWSASGQAFTLNWNLTNGASLDCTTLPIELLDLNATPRGREVDVTWATASELNTLHYEVQRSGDNKNWKYLGTVAAAGNSQFRTDYLFVDEAPLPGINYYRLKQVDTDGNSDLTHAVIAYITSGSGKPTVFPNPATDNLRVAFTSPMGGDVRFHILDATGRIVSGAMQPAAAGEQNAELPIGHLAKGWYNLRIILPDGTSLQSTGFLKQ